MPGQYVDLQVNGYAGVDFNVDDLSAEALHIACEALDRDDVAWCLATIITDDLAVMARRIRRVVRLREQDPLAARIIAGVHVEGPFLSPAEGYRGAHPSDAIREASPAAAEALLEAGEGLVRLFTLAPESDPAAETTRVLRARGVVVSAGHTNASLDELSMAIDAGLTMFTHLGNGCPMRGMDRHDNIIQRVLWLARRGRITPTFIGDGVHVPFVALSNYIETTGIDRAIFVSDAMAAAGLGAGRYRLGRWHVDVGDDLAAWAPDRSHLVGSAMSMKRAAENLISIGVRESVPALLHHNAVNALRPHS